MSVKMTAQVDITFDGAFDNCHIGCDSCDFITNTHTKYKDGKATGLEGNVLASAVHFLEWGEKNNTQNMRADETAEQARQNINQTLGINARWDDVQDDLPF